MAKKSVILGTKLFGEKTIEELNHELYNDFVLVKDNIDELLRRGIAQMVDSQTTMLLLPNLKALLDTGLKNSANMNQLISINIKTVNEKEESDDDIHSSLKDIIKVRSLINKEVGL